MALGEGTSFLVSVPQSAVVFYAEQSFGKLQKQSSLHALGTQAALLSAARSRQWLQVTISLLLTK